MTARYAIYYAPPADRLSACAAAWLGRDAWSGAPLDRPAVAGLDGLDLDAVTADPRFYGFHATLKAPFALAQGRTEAELLTAAWDLARSRSAFDGALAPAVLGRFIALRLTRGAEQMQALHEACLRAFEPFRAPPADGEVARRRRSGLTPAQDALLMDWGYPYVLDEFRFHMTLTGSVADAAERARLLSALEAHFAAEMGDHSFDGICVFRQPARDEPFTILARFAFEAAPAPISA